MTMPKPVGEWHMVCCATCGLLVGWTREPMTRPFYCIPCFDHVAHFRRRRALRKMPKLRESNAP